MPGTASRGPLPPNSVGVVPADPDGQYPANLLQIGTQCGQLGAGSPFTDNSGSEIATCHRFRTEGTIPYSAAGAQRSGCVRS